MGWVALFEASPYEADVHVLQGRFGFSHIEDFAAVLANLAQEIRHCRFVFEHELERCHPRLYIVGLGDSHDAWYSFDGFGPRKVRGYLYFPSGSSGNLRLEALWCVAGENLSPIHDSNAVAKLVSLGHVVCRKEHRLFASLDPVLDECPEVSSREDIDSQSRLIEEEYGRFADEPPCHIQPWLISCRQIANASIEIVLKVQLVDELRNSILRKVPRKPVELGEEPKVLLYAEDSVSRCFTAGYEVDQSADLGSLFDNIQSLDERLSLCGQEKSAQNLDEGRLTGAVRPQ